MVTNRSCGDFVFASKWIRRNYTVDKVPVVLGDDFADADKNAKRFPTVV